MANSTEAPYSVSFKTQRGTMVTVRGDSHGNLYDNLVSASIPVGDNGGTILDMIATIDLALSPGMAALGARPVPVSPVGLVPEQGDLPVADLLVNCDTCGCPASFQQEGFSKQSGKPYKRYGCTVSQLHKATFTEA